MVEAVTAPEVADLRHEVNEIDGKGVLLEESLAAVT
jgi:hypothetical protein